MSANPTLAEGDKVVLTEPATVRALNFMGSLVEVRIGAQVVTVEGSSLRKVDES